MLTLALATSATAQFELCETKGSAAGDRLGAAVGAALDTTGRSLVWIGAPRGSAIGQQLNTGTVTPRDASCTMPPPFFFPLSSAAPGDEFGSRIIAAGPNRLLAGAPRFDGPAGTNSGGARLIDASTGRTLRTLTGRGANRYAGSGIAVADIDGDGVLDHVVGSPGFVYVSSCSGINRASRTVGEVIVYSGADGSRIGRTQGDWHCSYSPVHTRIGGVLGSLGDVDGDGRDEFLIGSRHWSGDRVYVMSNGTGTLARMHTITGPSSFGSAVAVLDDLDGDGAPDFAVGAPSARQVKVYSGATGAALQVAWTGGIHSEFGATLANVGDQDGDGHADLLVGAPGASSGRGVAHVFSTTTGNLLASIWGNESGEGFGAAACAVPDWTGDPRATPEIAIGAPNANGSAGRCVVVTLDPDARPANAYWTRIGSACAPSGTSGIAPRIGTPNGPPAAGHQRFSISVGETGSGTQAILFLGGSQLPQPFCLGFVGMPSCCLEILPWETGISFTTVAVTSSTGAGHGVAIATVPLDPSIPQGITFYAQFYVMEAGVVFPGTMTSALVLVTR